MASSIRGRLRAARRRIGPRKRGLVLCYHRIAEPAFDPWSLCVSPDRFEDHLRVLAGTEPVPLNDLAAAGRKPGFLVSVTFDDGYADNVLVGLPLLERHGVPATIFLMSGFVGSERELWWDELERALFEPRRLPPVLELVIGDRHARRIAGDGQRERSALYHELYGLIRALEPPARSATLAQLLDWAGVDATRRESHRGLTTEEVADAARERLVEFGAHTRRHPVLAALDGEAQVEEIVGSKSDVEALTGGSVTSFAYPHGRPSDYTRETVEIVRSAGFGLACTTDARAVDERADALELPRVCVENLDGRAFEHALEEWARR